jgi:hypothetical protein
VQELSQLQTSTVEAAPVSSSSLLTVENIERLNALSRTASREEQQRQLHLQLQRHEQEEEDSEAADSDIVFPAEATSTAQQREAVRALLMAAPKATTQDAHCNHDSEKDDSSVDVDADNDSDNDDAFNENIKDNDSSVDNDLTNQDDNDNGDVDSNKDNDNSVDNCVDNQDDNEDEVEGPTSSLQSHLRDQPRNDEDPSFVEDDDQEHDGNGDEQNQMEEEEEVGMPTLLQRQQDRIKQQQRSSSSPHLAFVQSGFSYRLNSNVDESVNPENDNKDDDVDDLSASSVSSSPEKERQRSRVAALAASIASRAVVLKQPPKAGSHSRSLSPTVSPAHIVSSQQHQQEWLSLEDDVGSFVSSESPMTKHSDVLDNSFASSSAIDLPDFRIAALQSETIESITPRSAKVDQSILDNSFDEESPATTPAKAAVQSTREEHPSIVSPQFSEAKNFFKQLEKKSVLPPSKLSPRTATTAVTVTTPATTAPAIANANATVTSFTTSNNKPGSSTDMSITTKRLPPPLESDDSDAESMIHEITNNTEFKTSAGKLVVSDTLIDDAVEFSSSDEDQDDFDDDDDDDHQPETAMSSNRLNQESAMSAQVPPPTSLPSAHVQVTGSFARRK